MTLRVRREIGGWPLFLKEKERHRSLFLSSSSLRRFLSSFSRVPLDLCRCASPFRSSVDKCTGPLSQVLRGSTAARVRKGEKGTGEGYKCVRINVPWLPWHAINANSGEPSVKMVPRGAGWQWNAVGRDRYEVSCQLSVRQYNKMYGQKLMVARAFHLLSCALYRQAFKSRTQLAETLISDSFVFAANE